MREQVFSELRYFFSIVMLYSIQNTLQVNMVMNISFPFTLLLINILIIHTVIYDDLSITGVVTENR